MKKGIFFNAICVVVQVGVCLCFACATGALSCLPFKLWKTLESSCLLFQWHHHVCCLQFNVTIQFQFQLIACNGDLHLCLVTYKSSWPMVLNHLKAHESFLSILGLWFMNDTCFATWSFALTCRLKFCPLRSSINCWIVLKLELTWSCF